jgi:putative Mg2+ transporter-C (MgtC) family protein
MRRVTRISCRGIVIGVGFIGAGAIIRPGDITTGNATAASVWVVGIIGAAVGYGYYDIGIILAAANLGALLIRVRASAHSPEPAAVSQGQR